MKNDKNTKIFIYISIVLLILVLDRISKTVVLNILEEAGKVDIYINSFFSLYLVWNKGIGFGLFSSEREIFYNIVTSIIIIINLIILYMAFIEKKLRSFFLIMILGGSLGNLFDRIYYRAVPDFIDLNYEGYHWFIFNVADILISIGIICLILSEFLIYKSSNEK